MKRVSKTDFGRNVKKYLKIAETETVVITARGKPKWVLISAKEYTSLVFAAIGLKEVT